MFPKSTPKPFNLFHAAPVAPVVVPAIVDQMGNASVGRASAGYAVTRQLLVASRNVLQPEQTVRLTFVRKYGI
jgi:hypothetical protein